MSAEQNAEKKSDRRVPFYQVVEGLRLPGMFSPDAYRSTLAYKPRSDDLFIVTYPKCGTTWMQNIVACIYKNGKPFESAVEFLTQTPFLEMVGAEAAETMKRPGAVKVHLPFHLTPWSPESKYIFVARNPKDCCVSFYHHTENIAGYNFQGGSFDDFFELFIEGLVDFGDYFDTVMSWYEHRHDPNVLFITYEELKKDTVAGVLKIAEFMGPQYKEILEKDEKILRDVIYHSSFAFMKEHLNKHLAELQKLPKEMIRNNPDLPPSMRTLFGAEKDVFKKDDVTFVRKGIVGDWKNHFSPEQSARLEKIFKERMGNTKLAEVWKDIM